MKIDYLMFRDLAVDEVFTVTDRSASWIFHGRGPMVKTGKSTSFIENQGANARYLDNRRDGKTVAWVHPGYQVQRTAHPEEEEVYSGPDRVKQLSTLGCLANDILSSDKPGTPEEKVGFLLEGEGATPMPAWFDDRDRQLLIAWVTRAEARKKKD